MIINPDDTCFNTGVTAKTVLTAMDATTTPRTGLLFLDGGMMMARNIP